MKPQISSFNYLITLGVIISNLVAGNPTAALWYASFMAILHILWLAVNSGLSK